MNVARKLGWLRDPGFVQAYDSGHKLLARARADATVPELARASLLQFRGARALEQGGIGSCFAFGCVRAFQLYNAARRAIDSDVQTAIASSYDDLASPTQLYYSARAGEYVGAEVDSMPLLEDVGSYPYLGFQQIRALGFAKWSDCPYPTGADMYDSATIHRIVSQQPPPSVFVDAFDCRGLETGRVTGTGIERVRQVAALLKQRCPVGYGIEVDLGFMRAGNESIKQIDRYSIQGGHWMQVLAVVPSTAGLAVAKSLEEVVQKCEATAASDENEITETWEVIVDNWWGSHDWGMPGGLGRISAGLFGSTWVSDVTAVRFLPGA